MEIKSYLCDVCAYQDDDSIDGTEDATVKRVKILNRVVDLCPEHAKELLERAAAIGASNPQTLVGIESFFEEMGELE